MEYTKKETTYDIEVSHVAKDSQHLKLVINDRGKLIKVQIYKHAKIKNADIDAVYHLLEKEIERFSKRIEKLNNI